MPAWMDLPNLNSTLGASAEKKLIYYWVEKKNGREKEIHNTVKSFFISSFFPLLWLTSSFGKFFFHVYITLSGWCDKWWNDVTTTTKRASLPYNMIKVIWKDLYLSAKQGGLTLNDFFYYYHHCVIIVYWPQL